MYKIEDFIHMPIPASMFTAVCALLGGATGQAAATEKKAVVAKQATTPASDGPETSAQENLESDGNGPTAQNDASLSNPEGAPVVDAHGWPWSADLHASTKGTTKDGLWRMKVGVTRPDPKPGFPIEDAGSTSTVNTGETESSPIEAAATETVGAVEDDDEFAAFRAASQKVEAESASVAVPARKWTDNDLAVLCNQAAVKMGDPAPVKELIAKFVPEGEVPHSRNIFEDQREAFAQAVEAKAGITFAG